MGKTPHFNFVNFKNIPVTRCLQKCSNNQECNAVKFNFGNTDNNTNCSNIDEFNENGYCQLYSFPNPRNTTQRGDSVPALIPSSTSKYCYASLYKKKENNLTKSLDYVITNKDANPDNITNLQIKKSNVQDVQNIAKIYSKYQGAICRNDVNAKSCDLLNSYINNWCQQNPNSTTCERYCSYNNSNCPSRNITSIGIYSALVAVSLFLIIISFKTKKWTLFKILSLLSFVVFSVFLTIHIIRISKPIYDGSEPEVLPNWYSSQNCGAGTYKNVLGECVKK